MGEFVDAALGFPAVVFSVLLVVVVVIGDDPASRAVGALGLVADRVAAVEAALNRATDRMS